MYCEELKLGIAQIKTNIESKISIVEAKFSKEAQSLKAQIESNESGTEKKSQNKLSNTVYQNIKENGGT